MSIMELKKNQKYKIEIVLGYNGKKKIRYFETFHGKKSEAKVREFELKKLLKNGSVFQKKFYTFKDLAQKYCGYIVENPNVKIGGFVKSPTLNKKRIITNLCRTCIFE